MLRLFQSLGFEQHEIGPLGRVRWKGLFGIYRAVWMVNLFYVSEVEVAYSIKIHIPAIITISFTDELTTFKYSTLKILLASLWNFSNFEEAVEVVNFVVEF